MASPKEKVTTEDIQFLLLRTLFWLFFMVMVVFIHLDAKKENARKKQLKEQNDRLSNPTKHP